MTSTRKTQLDAKTPTRKAPPSPPSARRRWLWFGLRCLLYYFGVVLMLACFQRMLMYPSTRVEKLATQASGLPLGQCHDIVLQASDGLTLHGWHMLPKGQTAVHQEHCDQLLQQGGRVVLFFSGNGGNRSHRTDEYLALTNMGCHVMVFDYRGYGENPGSPSEKKFAEDALVAWSYVTQDRKVAPDRVILYGESLGGGVATRLAAKVCAGETPPGGLILRSTFSSMVDAASYNYPWLPVRMVLLDRYLSTQRIPQVTCPILILHGTLDTIVPLLLGRTLFEAAPERSASGVSKTFVELPGSNHNDILLTQKPLFLRSISEFLKKLDEPAQE